jgi:hypothetical protein
MVFAVVGAGCASAARLDSTGLEVCSASSQEATRHEARPLGRTAPLADIVRGAEIALRPDRIASWLLAG